MWTEAGKERDTHLMQLTTGCAGSFTCQQPSSWQSFLPKPTVRDKSDAERQQAIHIIHIHITYMSEKAMAPHSSTLVRKIPRTEEPGGLQSMGSLRVGHD